MHHDVSDSFYMCFARAHNAMGPGFLAGPTKSLTWSSYAKSSQHMAHDFLYLFLVGGELQSSEVTYYVTTFPVIAYYVVTFLWGGVEVAPCYTLHSELRRPTSELADMVK